MGKGNEKEEYADWSEEERTVHRLRDGLREVVAEGSFGAGYLKKGDWSSDVCSSDLYEMDLFRGTKVVPRLYTPFTYCKGLFLFFIERAKVRGGLIRGGNNE